MPRFCANLTMLFNEVAFPERFAEAARAGFRAVEFLSPYDYQPREVAERARGNGLEVILFNAALGDWRGGDRGLAALPGREHEFAAEFEKALRYAGELGTTRLHVMAGLVSGTATAEERERHRRTYVRNLRDAAAEAAARGVTLTIEPINQRDMPGYFLVTQAQAHAIREEVGAANLKVQMDFYHCQVVEGDIAEKFRRWQPHIGHVQVAGNPGRHEPDVGEVNYPFLFALLDELGYEGWVGCEYKPRGLTHAGFGWLQSWLK
ncbi:MAG: hydroxypyruvate isomerase family protein [Betaproteobacteria bacterium]|nr:hydroxypyruvate isomerase family protein [Betaproteobacteria bacterium]